MPWKLEFCFIFFCKIQRLHTLTLIPQNVPYDLFLQKNNSLGPCSPVQHDLRSTSVTTLTFLPKTLQMFPYQELLTQRLHTLTLIPQIVPNDLFLQKNIALGPCSPVQHDLRSTSVTTLTFLPKTLQMFPYQEILTQGLRYCHKPIFDLKNLKKDRPLRCPAPIPTFILGNLSVSKL